MYWFFRMFLFFVFVICVNLLAQLTALFFSGADLIWLTPVVTIVNLLFLIHNYYKLKKKGLNFFSRFLSLIVGLLIINFGFTTSAIVEVLLNNQFVIKIINFFTL